VDILDEPLLVVAGVFTLVFLYWMGGSKRGGRKKFDKYLKVKRQKAHKYIASKEWGEKRNKRFVIDHYTCQKCGTKKSPLQVHHKTYIRLMNEDVEKDIITVCTPCHEEIHRRFGYPTYGVDDRKDRRYWDEKWNSKKQWSKQWKI